MSDSTREKVVFSSEVKEIVDELGDYEISYEADSGVKTGTVTEALYTCEHLRDLEPELLRGILQAIIDAQSPKEG